MVGRYGEIKRAGMSAHIRGNLRFLAMV